MSRRRGASSVAANPVLIGAATTLVVIVAVFLAYNANNGLPFVPTYQVNAEVPSAANLVVGNDVRIGGTRVGVVSAIKPKLHRSGLVTALLTLKLQTSVRPLSKTSTILVRERSALGLKYVEITRGQGGPGFADGATIPISNATPHPVEIDEVFNTFNEPTRVAGQQNLTAFGNGLAGRGQDLNQAIFNLSPLLTNLVPVMQNLSDPSTRTGQLFVALERAASIVAPAAETQASLFDNLDTTFTALASVARPYIQQTITGGPPFLDAAIRGFPSQRAFLANTQTLFADLRPGIHALRSSAPVVADALAVGTRTLPRTVDLSRRLQAALVTLDQFSTNPLTDLGIRDLTTTFSTLAPTLAYLLPVQTKCNYVTLWFRNVSNLLSVGDKNGTGQRFSIIVTPQGPNNEGGPSSAPANGPLEANHFHYNPYPLTSSPGQPQESCQAANEVYVPGQTKLTNAVPYHNVKPDQTTIDRSGTVPPSPKP